MISKDLVPFTRFRSSRSMALTLLAAAVSAAVMSAVPQSAAALPPTCARAQAAGELVSDPVAARAAADAAARASGTPLSPANAWYQARVAAGGSARPPAVDTVNGVAGVAPYRLLVGEGWRYGWFGGDTNPSDRTERVTFISRNGALLSGTVFLPDSTQCPGARPAVLIAEGDGAREPYYWWLGQALAEAGYVAFSFDYQGQGLSEVSGHTGSTFLNLHECPQAGVNCERGKDGRQGGLMDAEDALEFLLSTAVAPYRYRNVGDANVPGAQPGRSSFPYPWLVDPEAIAVVGHSRGAKVASVLQGHTTVFEEYGGPAIPNPIDAIVALDNLSLNLKGDAGSASGDCTSGGLSNDPNDEFILSNPLAPALGIANSTNKVVCGAEIKKTAYNAWNKSDGTPLPRIELVMENSQHINDFSPTPANAFSNPWGTELIAHYTIAWLDRWLTSDAAGAQGRLAQGTFTVREHYVTSAPGTQIVTAAQGLDDFFTSSAEWRPDTAASAAPHTPGMFHCAGLRGLCPVADAITLLSGNVEPTTKKTGVHLFKVRLQSHPASSTNAGMTARYRDQGPSPTATGTLDYVNTPKFLEWTSTSSLNKSVAVPLLPDTFVEGNEHFTVQLVEPQNAWLLPGAGKDNAVLTIDDADD